MMFIALSHLHAADIADVSDLAAIKVLTDDIGIVNAGDVRNILNGVNFPELRLKLRAALAAKLAAETPLDAQARLTKLTSYGIALPKAVTDAHAARIEALRAQRETALMTVKGTDPARALAKMTELLAAGIPITTATQNAVKAAQPPPAVVPVVPTPPGDGL